MKKCILLLAMAVAVFTIFAQSPCPSSLRFKIPGDIGKADNLIIEVSLINTSENLNAFNLYVYKDPQVQWIVVDEDTNEYFTAKGYGKNILARWEGVTDEEREAELDQHCVIRSNRYDNRLLILEILSTNECRFFPTSDYYDSDIHIGRFAVDVSNLEDGYYHSDVLNVYNSNTNDYCFSYTGGIEGTCAIVANEQIACDIYRKGEYASFHYIPDDYSSIEDVDIAKKKETSVKYYNIAGMESAEPQQGMNIKVTTYSDGTRKSEKMMK